LGAIIGALSSEVILRWPAVGFHGLPTLIAIAAIAYPVTVAYRQLPRSKQRPIRQAAIVLVCILSACALPVVIGTVLAEGSLSQGQQSVAKALHEFRRGASSSAQSELESASVDFQNGSSILGSWVTEPSRFVPIFAQHRQALANSSGAASKLIQVASKESSGFDFRNIDVNDGQVDTAQISSLLVPAKRLQRSMLSTKHMLSASENEWLLAPVQSRITSSRADLSKALSAAKIATKVIPVLPAILGSQAERRYLVVFQSPAELRGLGGVITGYAEIDATDGKISLGQYGSVDQLDAELPTKGGVLNGPASFLSVFGAYHPQDYFQDETFAPDLPTAGEALAQLYPQAGGDPINGVIVIDPQGLSDLLQLTGPINVPGLPVALTSANASSELMEDQYILLGNQSQGAARQDYGEEALHLVFNKLISIHTPGPAALSKVLSSGLSDGSIAMWSATPKEEAVLNSLHAADAFPSAGHGDVLSVAIQNGDANKIDVFLRESLVDDVNYVSSTGSVKESVEIALKNGAPTSGLPPIVIDDLADPSISPGTNQMLLSIYSPLDISSPTVDGVPFVMTPGKEFGMNVYSGFVEVPSGSTDTVKLTLSGKIQSGSNYSLQLRDQPTANPIDTSVSVDNSGHRSTWKPGDDVIEAHTFRQ
jgi:hypothetical protein